MSGSPQLEVLSPGAFASVQDLGRRGYRRMGVPWAGALDLGLMRLANALAGNAPGQPVIECFDGGQQFSARGGALRVAVAGDVAVELHSAGERRVFPAWRSFTLADGEQLRLGRMPRGRIAIVALAGLALPLVLGSAATYARAGLGGLDGRVLTAGARLPAVAAPDLPEQMLAQQPAGSGGPIRVITGPQADHFSDQALATLFSAEYRVSTDADRMGVRLEGPALTHRGAPEIVSDATVPGSIQVPGNGQPIVLLADAQTAGGYPKIATVVSADLGRMAAARPGQMLRFERVDAATGEQLAREAERRTLALLATLRPLLAEGVDEAALYNSNLVSGVLHALSAEYIPQPHLLPHPVTAPPVGSGALPQRSKPA